jgi:hypothetical protein
MESGIWSLDFMLLKKKLKSILQQRSDPFSIFFILFFFCNNLNGQIVNIESNRIHDDSLGWAGGISGMFSAQKNKDLLLSANFRPKVMYKTKKHNVFIIGDYNFSKGSERIYSNAGMFHLRYAYRIKESPLKIEAYSQIQYNQLLDLRYRFLNGAGLRIKFIEKMNWKFYAGTSTFYERQLFVVDNTVVEDLRWSNYLSWYITPKDYITFTAATYYQPLWKDFNNYRVSGQYTLNFKITKQFSIKTELNFFHDSHPQPNVPKTIYATTMGFGFTFK